MKKSNPQRGLKGQITKWNKYNPADSLYSYEHMVLSHIISGQTIT